MTEKKLDWMYKGVSGLVDREAYLTGRKIDKTFELAQREEKGERIDAPVNESVPISLLNFPSSSSAPSSKLLDDPLIEIQKRRLEEARKILNNPLKMKKIKEMIEASANKESDRSSIKKKKKKKSNKKKHKHSRGDSSDDEKEKEKERRHKHKKSSRHHKHRSRSRSRSKSPSEKHKSRSRHR